MWTPKVDAYPAEFAEFFIQASSKRVELVCDSPEEAKTMRRRLYAFRALVYEQPDTFPRVVLLAPKVKLRLDGNKLIGYPNQNYRYRKILSTALEGAPK